MPLIFDLKPLARELAPALQRKIDQKTKPLGALGQLETLAMQIGLIQNTLTPSLNKPCIIVFAGDHGIAAAGVSAYPSSVTAQMVANFAAGGAAINVLARQHQIELVVVDAGVNADLSGLTGVVHAKQGMGTANFLEAPAMSAAQCLAAIKQGADLVADRAKQGCNVIGFGEMGIGNTSSAALLTHYLAGLPLETCVGRGTGLDDAGLARKRELLTRAKQTHGERRDAVDILSTFGGFEIAMMTGAYLQAAELGMLILADGFIATSALLAACAIYPAVLDYCVFSHKSDEQGHKALLAHLGVKPLLDLGLRLGEGAGIALAFPVVQSAVAILNEMASFAEAGVDEKRLPEHS